MVRYDKKVRQCGMDCFVADNLRLQLTDPLMDDKTE